MNSEKEVIKAIQEGDHRSFAILVESYQHMLFTLCVNMLKDRERAEELTQDSFLKAFRNIHSYRGESKFSTWIYKIAYHSCLTEMRKNKIIKLEVAERDSREERDAQHMMEEAERKDQVRKAMEGMKEEDRIVLQLFYLQEQSVKEIVEITGWTESKVKVKLHRSKARLKNIIEEDYPELYHKIS